MIDRTNGKKMRKDNNQDLSIFFPLIVVVCCAVIKLGVCVVVCYCLSGWLVGWLNGASESGKWPVACVCY